MTITPFTTTTLTPLTRLMLELWPDCDYDEQFAHVESLLENPDAMCLLAMINDVVAGFIELSVRHEHVEGTPGPPVAYIEGICVGPEFRALGIGRALVAAGAVWGKQKGCTAYASDTEVENTGSIAFHRSVGFEEASRVVCFVKAL